MKKKNHALFHFFRGKMNLRVFGISLLMTFFFLAATTDAAAQDPKIQKVQTQLEDLNGDLAAIPANMANHPKTQYYKDYKVYLEAVLADMQQGKSYGVATRANVDLLPQKETLIGNLNGNNGGAPVNRAKYTGPKKETKQSKSALKPKTSSTKGN